MPSKHLVNLVGCKPCMNMQGYSHSLDHAADTLVHRGAGGAAAVSRAESEKRIAHACGALGCKKTDDLEQVTVDGVTRTLCPSCREGFIKEALA